MRMAAKLKPVVTRNKLSREVLPDNSYDDYVPFDPVAVGLEPTFLLTQYAELRDLCRRDPLRLTTREFRTGLATKGPDDPTPEVAESALSPLIKKLAGRNICVTMMRKGEFISVQSNDWLNVMVDDPYLMGRIACSNLLGHIYGVGVVAIDNLLMTIGVGTGLTEGQRNAVLPSILRGFRDSAHEAGVMVTGGHTTFNPWCIVGGSVTTVAPKGGFALPNNATHGQVLVLTKPLGATLALWARRWYHSPNEDRGGRIRHAIDEESVRVAYVRAMYSMARSNRDAAILMRKFNATAYINVSGGGLLDFARVLAAAQEQEVDFTIYNLPVILKMAGMATALGFDIPHGLVPEYSGGLLIAFERVQAAQYCKEMLECTGLQVWVVGIVERGKRIARIMRKPRVIEANCSIGPRNRSIIDDYLATFN